MKRSSRWHRTAVVVALLGVITPQQLFGGAPLRDASNENDRSSDVQDIALDNGGNLSGQVVTENGTPAGDVAVRIAQNGRELTTVTTDEQGQFQVTSLRGGVYQITTAQTGANYRLWSPNTAPPAAQERALIVENSEVVRAQGGRIMNFLTNPWVLGLGVAAAIAIPLALDDDDDAS